MMKYAEKKTEVVVLGAGPAGYVCAIRLAQLGKKVMVVDRAEVGGVCLNRGCIPSKALIHAAGLLEKVKHAGPMGIEISGAKVHLEQMMRWKDGIVAQLTSGVKSLLKANACDFLAGEAHFLDAKTLEVKSAEGNWRCSFDSCVIATGSSPTKIPSIPVDQEKILDSTAALNLKTIPSSMLCIGGGYIGLELGTFYSKLGTKVHIVESGQFLAQVDPALTQVVLKRLEKKGVLLHPNSQVRACKSQGDLQEVTFSDGKKEQKVQVEKVLVTVGRTPNSKGLGLEKVGLQTDDRGFLKVDAQQRTEVAHLYAIGDIAGPPLLAHKGSQEGMIAAEVIGGLPSRFDALGMPYVVFTDPEIASVGWTEQEAEQHGVSVEVGTFPYQANGRALSIGSSDGLVKVVGDKKTGRLLGVHIVGAEASNLISEASLGLELGAFMEDIALTIHPHPTLSETLKEAAEAALGHAIHVVQKKKDSVLVS